MRVYKLGESNLNIFVSSQQLRRNTFWEFLLSFLFKYHILSNVLKYYIIYYHIISYMSKYHVHLHTYFFVLHSALIKRLKLQRRFKEKSPSPPSSNILERYISFRERELFKVIFILNSHCMNICLIEILIRYRFLVQFIMLLELHFLRIVLLFFFLL